MPTGGTPSSGENVAIEPVSERVTARLAPSAGRAGRRPQMPAAAAAAVERQVGLEAVMARAAHENFPVALRLLPRAVRGHLRAIYGYARLVDNLGDEYPGDRAAALDWVEAQLDGLFAGAPRHEAFVQLAPTVARFGLDREPFDQLLAANRLDQHKARYEDFDELLEYCTPVCQSGRAPRARGLRGGHPRAPGRLRRSVQRAAGAGASPGRGRGRRLRARLPASR